VLLIDLENRPDRLRERIHASLRRDGLTRDDLHDNLLLLDRAKGLPQWQLDRETLRQTAEQIEQHKPLLVIVDNLRRSLPSGKDEKDAKDINPLLRDLVHMCEQVDAALLIVHHMRKDGETYSGSSSLASTPGNVIMVHRNHNTGVATVRAESMRNAENFAPFSVMMGPDEALQLADGVSVEAGQDDRIIHALDDGDKTVAELVEATGLTESKVRAQVERLAQTGKIIAVDERQGAKGGKAAKVYRLAE